MSRFQAFAIDLGVSFVIFIFLAYLVIVEWYPDIFFDTDGGWRGMRIIIGVDLVLGPALTLVAFKAGKPGLRFDLTCIALLQTVCLVAGTWVVWQERPLAVVYVDSRFEVLSADDYAHLDQLPEFDAYPGNSPKWLLVDLPTDLDELATLRRESFQAGINLAGLADRYIPFDPEHPSFTGRPRDLHLIVDRDGGQDGLNRWLATYGGAVEDYAFYTFATRYVYRYVGFDRQTGERLGFLDVQPR